MLTVFRWLLILHRTNPKFPPWPTGPVIQALLASLTSSPILSSLDHSVHQHWLPRSSLNMLQGFLFAVPSAHNALSSGICMVYSLCRSVQAPGSWWTPVVSLGTGWISRAGWWRLCGCPDLWVLCSCKTMFSHFLWSEDKAALYKKVRSGSRWST